MWLYVKIIFKKIFKGRISEVSWGSFSVIIESISLVGSFFLEVFFKIIINFWDMKIVIKVKNMVICDFKILVVK